MSIHCDVLVAGGGAAGVAAAVTAARAGAQTILVERNPYLGGTAVTAMHRVLCGFYGGGEDAPSETLNAGIAREVVERLAQVATQYHAQRMGQVWVLPVSTHDLLAVLSDLVRGESKIALRSETEIVDVARDGARVGAVSLRGTGGFEQVVAGAVIECTGNGTILEKADVERETAQPGDRQFAGFVFRVDGIEGAPDMLPIQVPHALARAVSEHLLPYHLRFTVFSVGLNPGEGLIKLAVPPPATPERSDIARRDAHLVHGYLRDNLSAFRRSRVTEMSNEIVERDGTLLRGEYVLTEEDVLTGRKFDDGVLRSAWPIEIWDQKTGPVLRYLQPGEYYEIPARCLRSPTVDNLYCAGRCISVSRSALGSTRVTGTCLSLGEAAANAALGGSGAPPRA